MMNSLTCIDMDLSIILERNRPIFLWTGKGRNSCVSYHRDIINTANRGMDHCISLSDSCIMVTKLYPRRVYLILIAYAHMCIE